ncbi:MAG: LD-carboxypeptidase, partial [Patescibacteria group bacterium]
MPRFAGGILAIEDIGEAPYRIDRMLGQLWAAGALDGVKAVVLGRFTDCDVRESAADSVIP